MLQGDRPEVKCDSTRSERLDRWFNDHSTAGWYLAIIGMLNVVLNLIDLFLAG